MIKTQKKLSSLLLCFILSLKCFSQGNNITIDTSASIIINGSILKDDQVISLSFLDSMLKTNTGQPLRKQRTKLGDGQVSIKYQKLGIEVIGFINKRGREFSFSSIIFDPAQKGLRIQLLGFICSPTTSFDELYSISSIRNHIDTLIQRGEISSKEGLLTLQINHAYCSMTFFTSRKKMGKISRIQFYSPRSGIEKKQQR